MGPLELLGGYFKDAGKAIGGAVIDTAKAINPLKEFFKEQPVADVTSVSSQPKVAEVKKSPYADVAFNSQNYAPIGKTTGGKEITVRKSDAYESDIDEASKETGLSKKFMRTVLMKESSMGTDKTNYNKDIGEYAWLVGFTNIAKEELDRQGIKYDLSTPKGAIKASAQYAKAVKTRMDKGEKEGELVPFEYGDDSNFYFERYNRNKEYMNDPNQHETVTKLLDYYGSY